MERHSERSMSSFDVVLKRLQVKVGGKVNVPMLNLVRGLFLNSVDSEN